MVGPGRRRGAGRRDAGGPGGHVTRPSVIARWAVLGLVTGPAAFVAAWVTGGASTPGYSPVHDAISGLAAVGAPQRAVMTAGFVLYGAGVLVGSVGLRASVLRRAGAAVVVNALATLAVAALPLDRSHVGDVAHGTAATVGYLSLAAIAALCARPLADAGHRRAARASAVVAGAIAIALAATVVLDAKGLAQRAGLTLGDLWLAAAGVWLARGRAAPYRQAHRVSGRWWGCWPWL